MAPGGNSNRRQRIESELQRVLASLISREVKDPRVGLATVTAVKLANDMSSARVYVLPFGTLADGATAAGQGQALIEGLTRAAGFLRGEAGRALHLRHAPQLEFVLDESFDRAARLTALISGAVGGGSAGDR